MQNPERDEYRWRRRFRFGGYDLFQIYPPLGRMYGVCVLFGVGLGGKLGVQSWNVALLGLCALGWVVDVLVPIGCGGGGCTKSLPKLNYQS